MDLMTLAKDYFLENMGPDMLKQALNKESILIELFYLDSQWKKYSASPTSALRADFKRTNCGKP